VLGKHLYEYDRGSYDIGVSGGPAPVEDDCLHAPAITAAIDEIWGNHAGSGLLEVGIWLG